VAVRVADMARRSYMPIVGVLENMADFTCDHGTSYRLFGSGGGDELAEALNVPLDRTDPARPGSGHGWRRREAGHRPRSRQPGRPAFHAAAERLVELLPPAAWRPAPAASPSSSRGGPSEDQWTHPPGFSPPRSEATVGGAASPPGEARGARPVDPPPGFSPPRSEATVGGAASPPGEARGAVRRPVDPPPGILSPQERSDGGGSSLAARRGEGGRPKTSDPRVRFAHRPLEESPLGWWVFGDPLWGGSPVRFSVSTTKCSLGGSTDDPGSFCRDRADGSVPFG
jgi:hypothetical protein